MPHLYRVVSVSFLSQITLRPRLNAKTSRQVAQIPNLKFHQWVRLARWILLLREYVTSLKIWRGLVVWTRRSRTISWGSTSSSNKVTKSWFIHDNNYSRILNLCQLWITWQSCLTTFIKFATKRWLNSASRLSWSSAKRQTSTSTRRSCSPLKEVYTTSIPSATTWRPSSSSPSPNQTSISRSTHSWRPRCSAWVGRRRKRTWLCRASRSR